MRVALLMPNLNASPQTMELGLAYLASYVEARTHHEVIIIDVTFHSRHWQRYVREKIEAFKPDVIGVSILSVYFDHAKEILRDIKTYYSCPVIAGGYQPAMLPDQTIACDEFDAICTGEGELTFTDYLDRLERGAPLDGCLGVWFKRDGQVIKNCARPVIEDLDTLPMVNWDLFEDFDKYLYYMQRVYFIGSRGCPYRCTFCAETALIKDYRGKKFRERDPRKYVAEIEATFKRFGKRGMAAAHTFDTVFTFTDEWVRDFADEYKKRGLDKKLPYTVFVRPDTHNASDEKIRWLADSGCVLARFGVESSSDEVRLKLLKKPGCKADSMFEIFEKCNSAGIMVKTFAILGFPNEKKEQIKSTSYFCLNPRMQISFYLAYSPIPGTPMAAQAQALGGMNTSTNGQIYGFHFSRGARTPGVPQWYVPLTLLKCYLIYGMKIAWLAFRANPITFFPKVIPRLLMKFVWNLRFELATLYAVCNPTFWPAMARQTEARARRRKFRQVPITQPAPPLPLTAELPPPLTEVPPLTVSATWQN